MSRRREASVGLAIGALAILLALIAPGFFARANLVDISLGNLPVLVAALGTLLVILTALSIVLIVQRRRGRRGSDAGKGLL